MPVVQECYPVMNRSICTGCGDCLPVCPTQCLVLVQNIPVLTTAQACIQCTVCQIVCLPNAVEWKNLAILP